MDCVLPRSSAQLHVVRSARTPLLLFSETEEKPISGGPSGVKMIYDTGGFELNFVHKRVFGAAKAFIGSGGSPAAALGGFLRSRAPLMLPRSRAPISARTTAPRAAPRPVTRLREARLTGAPTAAPRVISRLAVTVPQRSAPPRQSVPTPCGVGFEFRRGKCRKIRGVVASSRRIIEMFRGPEPPTSRSLAVARHGRGFEAVTGAFGMPAMVPEEEMRLTLICPKGMVLGDDELCYPKAVLPRRSKFRKWRAQARAPVSAGDARAIRKAAGAKDRVLALAKSVGLHASKTKPRPAAKAAKHQHLLAAPAHGGTLRVISEG